ncbi:Gfo/Idh/MocA family protein [Nonomuraea sp. NPDC050547]|uniref:Gfo/Idh/MocA family protein n=1 Tax=unclassified Nonomuraea TaxID=2593643 RepID=UPI0037942667
MTRLGVIGYGRRIKAVLSAVGRVDPGARVVAIADPAAGAPEGADRYDDAATMLDSADLDGVLIGTRCDLHTPMALRVLATGLPLFLEKPVAIDRAQYDTLAAAAEGATSPVVVSFPLRLSSLARTVRGLLDEGVIGQVAHVQAVNNVPAYAVASYFHGWMRDTALTGGLWLQKATHDFDYLTYLIGRRPLEVVAMESRTVFGGTMPAGLRCSDCDLRHTCPEGPGGREATADWRCVYGEDVGNHDSGSALVRYESGLHVSYSQNFYSRGRAAARGATLIGHKGTISFDWYTGRVTLIDHMSGTVTEHGGRAETGDEHFGGDLELAREFVAACHGAPDSRSPLSAGLLSARLCLAAARSCRTGRMTTV